MQDDPNDPFVELAENALLIFAKSTTYSGRRFSI